MSQVIGYMSPKVSELTQPPVLLGQKIVIKVDQRIVPTSVASSGKDTPSKITATGETERQPLLRICANTPTGLPTAASGMPKTVTPLKELARLRLALNYKQSQRSAAVDPAAASRDTWTLHNSAAGGQSMGAIAFQKKTKSLTSKLQTVMAKNRQLEAETGERNSHGDRDGYADFSNDVMTAAEPSWDTDTKCAVADMESRVEAVEIVPTRHVVKQEPNTAPLSSQLTHSNPDISAEPLPTTFAAQTKLYSYDCDSTQCNQDAMPTNTVAMTSQANNCVFSSDMLELVKDWVNGSCNLQSLTEHQFLPTTAGYYPSAAASSTDTGLFDGQPGAIDEQGASCYLNTNPLGSSRSTLHDAAIECGGDYAMYNKAESNVTSNVGSNYLSYNVVSGYNAPVGPDTLSNNTHSSVEVSATSTDSLCRLKKLVESIDIKPEVQSLGLTSPITSSQAAPAATVAPTVKIRTPVTVAMASGPSDKRMHQSGRQQPSMPNLMKATRQQLKASSATPTTVRNAFSATAGTTWTVATSQKPANTSVVQYASRASTVSPYLGAGVSVSNSAFRLPRQASVRPPTQPASSQRLIHPAGSAVSVRQQSLLYNQAAPCNLQTAQTSYRQQHQPQQQQISSSTYVTNTSSYSSQWQVNQLTGGSLHTNVSYRPSAGRVPVTVTGTHARPALNLYPNQPAATMTANDDGFEAPQYLHRLTSIPEQPSQGDTWGVRAIPRKRSKRTTSQRSPYDV